MRTRYVSWGKNKDDERVLMALSLDPEKNQINTFILPENVVTKDLENDLIQKWAKNKEDVTLPEHSSVETFLNITNPLVGEGYFWERPEDETRLRMEWNVYVLSKQLLETYQEELKVIKEKVDGLTEYSSDIWEDLKQFWSKAQNQIRDRSLLREHSRDLRKETDKVFDQMKSLRSALKEQLRSESGTVKEKFKEQLQQIEEKIEKNLSHHPIFNDLKELQKRLKKENLIREDRNEIWKNIDTLFKRVKKNRPEVQKQGLEFHLARNEKRKEGLTKAMDRMEHSIKRDKRDLERLQKGGDNNSSHQLEAALREFREQSLQQKIESKSAKLEDMKKTMTMVDKNIISLREKVEIEKKKEELKKEKKEEIKAFHDQVKDDPELKKAIEDYNTKEGESEEE